MKPRYTVQFPKEEINTDTGEVKTFWPRIGMAFEEPSGRISVKLDSLPLNWNGRMVLYPVDER
jgi:hypothetical protein